MNSRKGNIVAFVIINYLPSLTEFQLQKEKAASQNKGCPYLILKTSGNFHHHHHSVITVVHRPERGLQRAFCCWPGAMHSQHSWDHWQDCVSGLAAWEKEKEQSSFPFHSTASCDPYNEIFCPIYTSLYHGRQYRAIASSALLGRSSVSWKIECKVEETQVCFG